VLLAATAVAQAAGVRPAVPADLRDWLLAALCAPLGARLAAHDRRNACGWLLLAVGCLGAGTVAASLATAGPALWLRGWSWWPGYGLLVLTVLLFPGGRPASRRWAAVTAVLAAAVVAGTVALAVLVARAPGLLTGAIVPTGLDRQVFLAASATLAAGGLLAVVAVAVRIRRSTRRGPLLWAAANAALLVAGLILEAAEAVPLAWAAGVVALPVATVVGVLRYGLYDLGLLVHRSLLHGTLTVAVLALYAAAVTATTHLLPSVAAPAAIAVTVVGLLPLRQHVQSLLDHLLYGRRPYDLVTDLGRSAGDLTEAATRLATGLRVPYLAVIPAAADHPGPGGPGLPVAEHGHLRSWPVTVLPVAHAGETLGRLVVQQRGPGEPWTRREQAVLADLAVHFGPVLAAAHERHAAADARAYHARRLQRDLHDGLGPALFGARLLVRAGRARAGDDTLRRTLDDLDQNLAGATAEVRRIVADLAPAALDRGLAAALDGAAARHGDGGLRVVLAVAADLSGLPAAVEVAAYRVVDEALTNVGRHARARTATVTVTRDDGVLRVTVGDDGTGGAADRPGGIGLPSLRERCRELGGTLTVAPGHPGTTVRAEFSHSVIR
jgi:signal transduction histidine kinase